MKTSAKAGADSASQSDKFIEAARGFGCDEDEKAFERTVRKVARSRVTLPSVNTSLAPKPLAPKRASD